MRLALLLLVVGACATSSWNAVQVGQFNLSDLFLVASAALAIFRSMRRSLLRLNWAVVLPVVTVVLVFAVDLPLYNRNPLLLANGNYGLGIDPRLVVGRILLSTLFVYVAPYAALIQFEGLVERRRAGRLLVSAAVCGAAVNGVVALSQSVNPTNPFLVAPGSQTVGADRFPGLATHPNSLAAGCGVVIGLSLWMIVRGRPSARILGIVSASGLIVGILESGSRAGIIGGLGGVAVGLVAVLWIVTPASLRLVSTGIGLAIIAFVGSQILGQSRFASGDAGAVDSDLGRISSISDGWSLFLGSPIFGAGVGRWYGELSPLILLVSGGVLLLLAYVIYFAYLVVGAIRSTSAVERVVTVVSVLALLSYLSLNNGILERYNWWPLVLLGLLAKVDSFALVAPHPIARSTSSIVRVAKR